QPIPGREGRYSVVMDYRVRLARDHERELSKAARLQEKVVLLDRQRAGSVTSLPQDVPLDGEQRHLLRTLGVSLFALGQVCLQQDDAACLALYKESLAIDERIGDKSSQAADYLSLGTAYKDIGAIRDLDAAEAAYQRSLELRNPNDALGHCICIKQIGMVHH